MAKRKKPAEGEQVPPHQTDTGSPVTPEPKGVFRNRVIERRRMRGVELTANDRNWRVHTKEQIEALGEILETIGMAGELLAYYSKRNEGKLTTINGHLRSGAWASEFWDVAITDLNDEEADKLLAAMDPIGAAAEVDEEKLRKLIAEIDAETDALQTILNDTAGIKEAEAQAADELELRREYNVLIQCEEETDQRILLNELHQHGLNVKALIVDFPKKDKAEPKAGPSLKEGEIEITRSSEIERTSRVLQLEGLFDIPPSERREERWRLKISLDRPWNIGLIVGPSGSGKTTLARELFSQAIVSQWPWTAGRAIVDDFPDGMPITEITALLSSVGFSSPPSWLKPFSALSNGEQFRVMLARTLAEQPDLAVVDEFTSVVDRTVAKIGSAALTKAIRGTSRQFIAVACHYDIEEWLQPDWKIEMPSGLLTWRLLRRRPEIQLHIRRAHTSEWEYFRRHHYLDHGLHRAATCFIAEVEGRPAAFTGSLHKPHKDGGYWSEHRTVCHPDFQGIGIGNAMSEFVASVMRCKGKGYRSVTTHPAMIRHRLRSPLWICTKRPNLAPSSSSTHAINNRRAAYRMSASFQYIGPANEQEARNLGVI